MKFDMNFKLIIQINKLGNPIQKVKYALKILS